MSYKKWVNAEIDKAKASALSEKLNIDAFVAFLLVSRGIDDELAASEFLSDGCRSTERAGRRNGGCNLLHSEGLKKMARTLSPCHFWRFPSFARKQYPRTALARKIRNLSRFLKVYSPLKYFYPPLFFALLILLYLLKSSWR